MIFISVVIPLYNKQDLIIKTLESIKNQNYQNYEVIIVDDGSIDKSNEIVNSWLEDNKELINKFKITTQINQGVSAARNTGVERAQYDYIAFLDADDYWMPNHLLDLVELIENYSDKVDLFSTSIQIQLNQENIFPELGEFRDYSGVVDFFKVSMISQGFIHSSSVCVKRDAIKKYKFPKNMKNFEDVITWARIANTKGFAFTSKSSVIYVADAAEASVSVDFLNYIRFEKLFFEIRYNKKTMKEYINKIFLFSILAARIQMPISIYFKELFSVIGKSRIVTIYGVIGLLIPKFIWKLIRNKRKR